MAFGSRARGVEPLVRGLQALFVLGAMWSGLLCPSTSLAAEGQPEFFARMGPESGLAGEGEGELDNPIGVAADKASGHVFVSEFLNARISEFTAWGEFVKAWGWGVRDGSPELQTCTAATGCLKGTPGGGTGQFNGSRSVAVDAAGNVYVSENGNRRVEKFDADGNFILMFGGDVNKTKVEEVGSTQAERNLCTAASGDVCQAGKAGTGPSEFAAHTAVQKLAVDPAGTTIYVSDVGRIQEFDQGGNYLGEIGGALAGETVKAIAVSASGIYVTLFENAASSKEDVRRLDASGAQVGTLDVLDPRGVAVDEAGAVWVINQRPGISASIYEVLQFDSTDACVICEAATIEEAKENFATPPEETTVLAGIAANTVTAGGGVGLYVANADFTLVAPNYSFVDVYGPPPANWPPPVRPPDILAQFASSVDPEGALLRAQINPWFWADTRYYLEYGTAPCGGGGCSAVPAPPGSLLTDQVVSKAITTASVALGGLAPATTYHYRFVAQSGGGGPVFGADLTFTTPSPAFRDEACANNAFRTGAAAFLPDCRAYEQVSPGIDDVVVQKNLVGNEARLDQAALGGGALTYSSYRAEPDSQAAPYSSQYLAQRGDGGWSNSPLSPPGGGAINGTVSQLTQDYAYKFFSPDLAVGWVRHTGNVALDPPVAPGFLNFYRRDLASSSYEALIEEDPEVEVFVPELQGVSEDGRCIVFRVQAALTPNANLNGTYQTYRSCEGALELVSVLPGGAASEGNSSAGTPGQRDYGRETSVLNAISADGSRIYWSESASGPGKLYLRITSGAAQTLEVSSGAASFWGATEDGGRALVAEGGELFRYDLAEALAEGPGERTAIGSGTIGVLGASEDLTRIYFASTSVLAPGGEGGKPNLYLWEEGATDHIATLSASDASTSNEILSPVLRQPFRHSAQVTADGGHLVFMSTASLTGYDNVDQASGEADAEVYRYAAGSEELACVSCNPSGARPAGRNIKEEAGLVKPLWAAAWFPPGQSQLYSPRVISEDGARVYFNSFDPLLVNDTNARQDVYQWEAPGKGTCTEAHPTYSAQSGGCLSLISSGENAKDSYFVDSSADGADVFFRTAASLVGSDSGVTDIYDARVGGGFPPTIVPVQCQGEACQSPAPAPEAPTPSSLNYYEPPPRPPARGARKCPKGKHKQKRKGKVRCVKNKKSAKANKKRQGQSRGAAR